MSTHNIGSESNGTHSDDYQCYRWGAYAECLQLRFNGKYIYIWIAFLSKATAKNCKNLKILLRI